MARADLNAIQSKLKQAIQNHQKLVVKMKADPENSGLRKKIHHLQGEIMVLSDEQKNIVQNLRKELVKPQPLAPKPVSTPASQAAILPRPPQPVQSQAIIIPTNLPPAFTVTVPAAHVKGQVCNNPLQQLAAQLVSSGQTLTIQPIIGQNIQATDLTNCKMVWTTLPQAVTVNNNIPLKATPPSTPTSRSSSPPIRVPQYHINTNKSPTQATQALQNHDDNLMPPPPETKRRKFSDSELPEKVLKDIRVNVDKPTYSPEERRKMEFMASLDLISKESLKELQGRRTERKRRSTANPQFTYQLDQARKKVANYLLTSPRPAKRPRGRPPKHGRSSNNSSPNTPDSTEGSGDWKNGFLNGSTPVDCCVICGKDSDLIMCNACNRMYHPYCVTPPIVTLPQGIWNCAKCQPNGKHTLDPSGLCNVNSYITAKAAKEDEKRKLRKRNAELANEKTQLEVKRKKLQDNFQRQVKKNRKLVEDANKRQQSIDNLKNLMKAVKSK